MKINITTASANSATHIEGTVVLGFGPQEIDWLSKAAKVCGRSAVVDPDVARMAGANLAAGAPAALAALRQRLEAGALQHERELRPGAPVGAVEWLASGERGLSSEALFTRLTGIETRDARRASELDARDRKAWPRDPADLRRCRLMLETVPSLQANMHHGADLSTAWAALISAWPELCALMDEETPDWRTVRGQAAPRLYARMKQLTAL